MAVADETFQAVDQYWRTARDIWQRVGCWGFTSIRHALTKLEHDGAVEAKLAPHHNGEVIKYRLARADSSCPKEKT